MQALGSIIALLSRTMPFEKGRWRAGHLAYKLLENSPKGGPLKLVSTRHGFSMRLDLSEFVDRTIYTTGEWEPLETAVTKQLLRPGGVFVDVGANIGYFTALASRLVGPQGRVYSIESNPSTLTRLNENIELAGTNNIQAMLCAVGEAPGEAIVVCNGEGNIGGDSVKFDPADGEEGDRIPVRTLDWLFREVGKISLIKIDIEGAEAQAIRGGKKLFQGADAPDIILEFTPKHLAKMGDDPANFLALLRAFGYELFECRPDGVGVFNTDVSGVEQVYLLSSKKDMRECLSY